MHAQSHLYVKLIYCKVRSTDASRWGVPHVDRTSYVRDAMLVPTQPNARRKYHNIDQQLLKNSTGIRGACGSKYKPAGGSRTILFSVTALHHRKCDTFIIEQNQKLVSFGFPESLLCSVSDLAGPVKTRLDWFGYFPYSLSIPPRRPNSEILNQKLRWLRRNSSGRLRCGDPFG